MLTDGNLSPTGHGGHDAIIVIWQQSGFADT
jgi:hypothetical protein